MSENKFEGWGAFDKDSINGKLKWFEYEPKQFADDDLECESSLLLAARRAVPTQYHTCAEVAGRPLILSEGLVLRHMRVGPPHHVVRMGRHDQDVSPGRRARDCR